MTNTEVSFYYESFNSLLSVSVSASLNR